MGSYIHIIASLCALRLFSSAHALAPEVTPAFQAASDSTQTLGNATVLLRPGSPQFTFWSDVNSSCTTAPNGGAAACSPQHWLAVALRDVYEIDGSGKAVTGRGGAEVLDATGVEWSAQQASQLGEPAVPAFQSSFVLPYRQALPACPLGATVDAGLPAGGSVTLSVALFGGETNLTYFNATQEMLPGNLKWSVTVERWPFCDPTHSLVLSFGLLPANASEAAAAGQSVMLEQGQDIEARLAEQEALLTGAADPDSLPVEEAAADAGSSGRRRILRARGSSGGSRPSFSRPSTKPSTKPATTPSGGTSTLPAAAAPYRPYWPAGGTRRPRYSTPAAAMSSLPFTAAQRPFLASRFVARRPVYGFGRPAFLPFSAFLFFPLLAGSRQQLADQYAPMVQVQRTVILDNTTLVEASLQVLPAEPFGVVPMLVTVPYFQTSAFFDPIVAITESDQVVTQEIQAAIDEMMAYGDAEATSAALPRGAAAAVLQAVAAAALVAAAAAVML